MDVNVTITKHDDHTYLVLPTANTPTPNSFYFGFSREFTDFGPKFEKQLNFKPIQGLGAEVSYDDYGKLHDRFKELIDSLDELAKT